jgi:predicted nucleotidyltransferase component of viral defense system
VKDTVFFKQAKLLLTILPLIYREDVFALKGGTAINFFVRDLPRLSVDIDLTYLPVNDRDFALNEIRRILLLISERIKRRISEAEVIPKRIHGTEVVRGLIVNCAGVTVKIEPNLVLRGAVYPPEIRTLSKKAQDLFELSLQSRTLSKYDLYAGKICAALDRQHPRDLFDVYLLLKSEGLTSEIRKAFIVYLVSHPRPIVEILNPQQKDISGIFEKEFKDMIAEDIALGLLETTRDELVAIIREELTPDERRFIVSIKQGQPLWDLLELEGIKDLPAVKWKLLNISRMDPTKHRKAVHKLKDYLGV